MSANCTIGTLFLATTSKFPNQNAIGYFDKRSVSHLTFAKYKDTIEALSVAMTFLGLEAQSKVCILSATRKEWHFMDLAIMLCSGVTVPIYPSYTAAEVFYILNHSESEFLIIENLDQLEKIIEIQDKLTSVKTLILMDTIPSSVIDKIQSSIRVLSYGECFNIGIKESQNNPDKFQSQILNISPEDICSIIYTSGTTGEPKGAVIKHEALYQVLINVQRFAHSAINEKDSTLCYLPLSHVFGRLESMLPIVFGLESVYAQSINKVLENIAISKPTIFMAVPRVLEKIFEKAVKTVESNEVKKHIFSWAMDSSSKYYETINKDKTPSSTSIFQHQLSKKLVFNKIYQMFGGRIRYFISGGAPLNTEIIKFLRNANLTVLEGYGLTETIAPCCINPLNKQVIGSVGQPIGDVETKFLDDGEILIKSKALFSGYYKNEEETLKVMDKDGWFHTGDIGRYDSQGYLVITDRKKDIIITSGGKNIAPQKVENSLKLCKHISQAIVIGDKRKYLTALISIDKEAFDDILDELEFSSDCDYIELASHPATQRVIEKEIEGVNTQLANYETIKEFKIMPCEISTDNYLTPSLKVKRKLILKDFGRLIETMYQAK